jgi:hypothetical protein
VSGINENSLMKHIDEIRFILTSTTLEVLAINESKLDNSINYGEIHIAGYKVCSFTATKYVNHVSLATLV